MGVPRLFPWLVKNCRKAVRHFQEGDFTITVDVLYIDANAILHGSDQTVYNYGSNRRLIDDYAHLTPKQKQTRCFELFFDVIKQISNIVIPTEILDISLDGPAPLSKQAQQRQRRFASAAERGASIAKGGPDSNKMTPGTLFMFELTKFMQYAIRRELNDPNSPWHKNGIKVRFSCPTVPGEGEHKCYSPETKVLLWSGEIKEIKDVKIGDYVVSDEGKKRRVVSLVSGTSEMFMITQKNGNSYTVTGDHIMCFDVADHCRKYYSEREKAWIIGYFDRETISYKRKQFSGNKNKAEKLCDRFLSNIDHNSKINIKLSDYLKLPKRTQKLMYGYKCRGIDWPEQDINLDPYILGTWLGDGSSSGQGFCSIDPEIVQAWQEYARSVNCQVNVSKSKGKNQGIVYNVSGNCTKRKKGCNYIFTELKNYNLINNKHIPKEYMCNSRDVRLRLLAGLIDTDGNVTHNGRMIRFNQGPANYRLFDQVVILARSLGFKCCIREAETTYTHKDEKRHSIAKFLTISGSIEDIPTKLPRKKCFSANNNINIDRLRTSITVSRVGRGKYVGINVTGNRKFLLEDCTVVHNCLDNLRNDRNAQQKSHCFYGPDGDLIMLTLAAHVPKMFLFREDQFSPGFYDLLDMGKVRKDMAYLLHQGPGITSQKRTLNDVSNDFILAGFFVGNDFLPKIQMFMYLEDGLELMIATYASISKGGTQNVLTNQGKTKRGEINHEGFTRFIEELSRREHHYIADQAKPKADKSGRFLDPKFDNHTLLRHILENGRLNMTGYRHDYYAKMEIDANNENQIRSVCKDYIRSIAWVFQYYVNGLPSWRDYYRWHYAPLMSDLVEVMRDLTKDEIREIYHFEMDEPSPPFVQLLSVLPPVSAYLLPVPFQKLLTKQESVLVKAGYYPPSFKIDLEGKTKEHMGVALLPFVDYEIVYAAYKGILPTLKNTYVRNNLGKPCIFEIRKDYTCNYTSDYGNIGVCHVRKIV